MKQHLDKTLGNEVAQSLFETYSGDLFHFVLGILRDEALSHDVLQTTFFKLLENGHSVSRKAIRSWLFRVAHNEAIERRRRQSMELRHRENVAFWRVRRNEHDGQDQLVAAESKESVRKALATLPAEQQTVVRMRMYEDKKFAVIAEELGIPLGTVLTRMRAALAKLRNALADQER
ncbi:MAG: sigma-70 family RNA polymerase sigma factor [Pirellulaceae bacterium]